MTTNPSDKPEEAAPAEATVRPATNDGVYFADPEALGKPRAAKFRQGTVKPGGVQADVPDGYKGHHF